MPQRSALAGIDAQRRAKLVPKPIPRRVRPANAGLAFKNTRPSFQGRRPPTTGAGGAASVQAYSSARSGWTALVNQMPDTLDPAVTPGTALLLTDGTVLAKDAGTAGWWRLTPDAFGSCVNGTWAATAPMPYAPLYFASAVLPDGCVIVAGGEYVDFNFVFSVRVTICDPQADTWTPVLPPPNWLAIGAAQSVLLPDGTFMAANPFTFEAMLFDAASQSWRPTGSGKADAKDEEGWTLLPNGKVLTVDANNFAVDPTRSELYDPASGTVLP